MSFDYDLDDDTDLDDANDVALELDEPEEEYAEGDDDLLDLEDIDFEALGIDPKGPTLAKPGSEQKVLTLAARYAAGVPLWHDGDCYDHGPGADWLGRLARGAKS
ncbi:MAG: hypothetical protein KF777_07820 [Planctomycetaceae bacterium]|nr:hypothetical protein [Planctomycetaceae bacterium]